MKETCFNSYIAFGFNSEQNALLFADCPVIHKKKHELLYCVGDYVNTIYYVKLGKLKQYTILSTGLAAAMSYHCEGSTIGVVSSFAKMPSVCCCEAICDSALLMCPAELYWHRLEEHNLLEIYASIEARKANYGYLMRSLMRDSLSAVETLLNDGFTQQEIADFLGYSRVHVSRICSQLKLNARDLLSNRIVSLKTTGQSKE